MNNLGPKENHLNRQLMRMGLATLDQPRELLDQIAFFIENHDDFRNLLVTVEPDKRQDCYDSIKPRLKFEPRSLESYIAEARRIAEVQKQAIYDHETGKIKEMRPIQNIVEEVATEAILRNEAKGSLEMECYKCTAAQVFSGKNKKEALKVARKAGWVYDFVDGDNKEICPKCPAFRPN